MIHKPKHYDLPGAGFQVLEAARRLYGKEAVLGFLHVSALKYRLRAGKKDPGKAAEDLSKALGCERLAEELKTTKGHENRNTQTHI